MVSTFFTKNRERLIASSSPYIVTAYSSMQRGNDASFSFEQEANFWYLTGIEAPGWWVIIDGQNKKSWLVAPEVDDVHQMFDGSLTWDDAKKISGIETVVSRTDAEAILRDLAKQHSLVYTVGDDPRAELYDFVVNPAQRELWLRLVRMFVDVQDCRKQLARLRAIKQPEEIRAIKRAIKLTVDSFKKMKLQLPNLKTEYEVEAEFTYAFRRSGAVGHAYDPIVASGKNACTLHYNQNQQKLQNNSLLLLDIGARVDGYAADITRTFVVGTPTERQRQVHAAVERAHKQIITLLRPGLSVAQYHAAVDDIMQDALMQIGLLDSKEDTQTYRKYFPHAVSHGLGIDVHDSLGGPTEFASGMVVTVEPGIYIPEEGIGVRIEDDILITDTGHINLSAALPTSL